MSYLDLADRNWPPLNRAFGAHAKIYQATGGVLGPWIPGLPRFLLLEHVGARSGIRRTSPLVYLEDGDDIVLVASKGGHPKHPAWFHNLRANPETTVQIGRERRRVRARVATPEERDRLWPKAVETWGGYAGYQERTDREIPLVILEAAPPKRHPAAPRPGS